MAISKSASAVMLGFGSASSTRSGTATLSTGATSNTLTMALSQPCQTGYVRVQAQRYSDTVQLFLALGGTPPDLELIPNFEQDAPRFR